MAVNGFRRAGDRRSRVRWSALIVGTTLPMVAAAYGAGGSDVERRHGSMVAWDTVAGSGVTLDVGARASAGGSPSAPVVWNSAPRLSQGWTVSREPVLQIGMVDGPAAYQFGSPVWDATRLADGRIVASDNMTSEIRIFDSDGVHLRTIGGRGQGPGEFTGPPWIKATADGGIVAWDPVQFRLSWFDASGDLGRTVTFGPTILAQRLALGRTGRIWDLVEDGTLLFFSTSVERVERDAAGLGESVQRAVLISDGGDATQDIGGWYPFSQDLSVQTSAGATWGIGNQWAPNSSAALGARPLRVAISDGSEWEIHVFAGDGTLERVIRADIPRAPLTPAIISAALDRTLASMAPSGLTPGQVEGAWARLPFPDSVPAIRTLHFDETGHLWAGHRDAGAFIRYSARYEVFDPEGRWVTSVELPPDLARSGSYRILELGDDYLLTQWSGDFDVPYLRMYRIVKPDR